MQMRTTCFPLLLSSLALTVAAAPSSARSVGATLPSAEPAAFSASADFDRDGRLDVFVVRASGGAALYRNAGDGCFEDVTVSAGLTDLAEARGALWTDLDGDGWLDLYVACLDGGRRRFHNSAGTFLEDASLLGGCGLGAAGFELSGSTKGKPGGGGGSANPAIAFVRSGALWVMDANGANARQVYKGSYVSRAEWSSDGTQLIFETGSPAAIWSVPVAGGTPTVLKSCNDGTTQSRLGTSWSNGPTADGFERIAFIDKLPGAADSSLFVMKTDGSDALLLLDGSLYGGGGLYSPSWGPGGGYLVVTTWPGDVLKVNVGLIGGVLSVTSTESLVLAYPSSPLNVGGGGIGWVAMANASTEMHAGTNGSKLWRMDITQPGTSPVQVTTPAGGVRGSSFGPNDSKIVFAGVAPSGNALTFTIYQANPDGSGRINLSNGKSDTWPTWKPVP